jgi:PAS domain-containing protein
MDYEKLLEAVQELDFIADPKTADAAVKAVLGILASANSIGLGLVAFDDEERHIYANPAFCGMVEINVRG